MMFLPVALSVLLSSLLFFAFYGFDLVDGAAGDEVGPRVDADDVECAL